MTFEARLLVVFKPLSDEFVLLLGGQAGLGASS
jgi:hypothetical protein